MSNQNESPLSLRDFKYVTRVGVQAKEGTLYLYLAEWRKDGAPVYGIATGSHTTPHTVYMITTSDPARAYRAYRLLEMYMDVRLVNTRGFARLVQDCFNAVDPNRVNRREDRTLAASAYIQRLRDAVGTTRYFYIRNMREQRMPSQIRRWIAGSGT